MLILGHAGITAFIASMIYLPALGAVIGVLLPDVIDKGLFFLNIAPCARFIAHTVFFFPFAGLAAYAITREKKFAVAVMLGAVFHLVEDTHYNVPWFYPFVDYEWLYTCKFGVSLGLFELITESIGLGLLILIFGYREKLIAIRKSLWNFIRGGK